MTALEDLVIREASGVLEVTGSPSGAVYLDGGRIAFARASWVPGLAARLGAVSPALAGLGEGHRAVTRTTRTTLHSQGSPCGAAT